MATNYQKVKEFNECADVDRYNSLSSDETPEKNVFTEKKDLLKLRMDLIREEMRELEEAVEQKNIVEVRDALADILYVVYGMQDTLGIDGDNDYSIVHNSNMSKFCISEEEATKTVHSYQERYNKGEVPYDSPYTHFLKNQNKWVVKNRSTGKVLKSINYTQVKW
jgi:predicted HAD superfamily Cof-like phosphohydrolase